MSVDYDREAGAYARNRRVHPGVLAALEAPGRVGPRRDVLEVGCGSGQYLAALCASGAARLFGLEPSAGMRGQAGQNLPPEVIILAGRAEDLPFKRERFDLVYTVDVVHQLTDTAAFFGEAFRALKPGGRILTATDSEWVIRNRRPLSNYFPETVLLELARYPSINRLKAEMAGAGFENITEDQTEYHYLLQDAAPYREKAFSILHLISEEQHARGLALLEKDLAAGPVRALSLYTLISGERPGKEDQP